MRPRATPALLRRASAAALSAAALLVVSSAGAPTSQASVSAPPSPASAQAVVTVSSGTAGAPALVDGDVPRRLLGAEWSAAPGDTTAWVQFAWAQPRRVSSVQVFGSTAGAYDPKQSTAAALHGVLRFSDGTSVDVSGIAAGEGMPTTVAFPAKATTSVRLELARQIPDAPLALREMAVYEAGTTPPRWSPPAGSATYAVTPDPTRCSAGSPPLAAPAAGRLTLACPTPGSSVRDSATAVVNAPPGTQLTAWVARPVATALDAPLVRGATATAGSDGRATLTVDVRGLPQGPFALKVTADNATTSTAPLYVQLFRAVGAASSAVDRTQVPSGLTLQYDEEFDAALSISQTGWGSDYAAVKPEPWGGSQFGGAVLADPAWGAGTMATLPGGFLRIRAQDIGSYASKQSWGQRHISGILSSQRFGGSGLSAQYGYFEARILGAPGPGAWPAFWMLNSESGTGRANGTAGEVDAVELYGHDTRGACHSTHAWGAADGRYGDKACLRYAMDWAAEWHTYGVKVLPGGAEFFVDGRSVAKLDELSHTDEPFFFMLDLATGGGWPVVLSATGETTDMYVDWVRVYTGSWSPAGCAWRTDLHRVASEGRPAPGLRSSR